MYFVWEEALHCADGGKRAAAGFLELLHRCFHHLGVVDCFQRSNVLLDFPAGNLYPDQYLNAAYT